VLAENVAGHVSMGLDEVRSDLESEDYTVQPIIVPACAVNALHRRDRVWVIANSNSKRFTKNNIQEKINRQVIGEKQPIVFDLSSRIEQGSRDIRGNDGLSDRVDANRVKALGNAIVPQVAYEIINAMIKADEKTNESIL
jgi:DNA (cytosine-5)-methyltransferase 1